MPVAQPDRPVRILLLFLLFFCSTFFFHNLFAQNPTADSLKVVLSTLPDDSVKVRTLVLLARQFSLRDEQTLKYAQEAYTLAERIKYNRGKASSALTLGRYFDQQNKPDEALKYFREAIVIFEAKNNINGVAACFNNIGIMYYYQNQYDSAIANYNRALARYEQLADDEEVAKLKGNIGVCYEVTGDYAQALKLFFEALKVDERINNVEGMAGDYNAIAIIYNKQGDFEKAQEFHQKALDLYLSLNDPYSTALAYVNIGPVYMKTGNYENALDALNKALNIFREINEQRGESVALHSIGEVYLKQKDYRRAVRYFKRSFELNNNDDRKLTSFVALAEVYANLGKTDSALFFAKNGLPIAERLRSQENTQKIAEMLYQIYKGSKDYRNALLYHEKYLAAKDSLFNIQKTAQFRELQTRYETEKKEQQIAILNSENKLQESALNQRLLLLKGSIGVILLIIVFSVLIIRSNRRRQESERQLLNEQLRIEKMEAEKLLELDEMKSRFFANIAHEFKTPLTLISGPVENLLEENHDNYTKDQLQLVKRNSTRLLKLVNQLLDLSKLESGVAKLELQKEDIISFVKGLTFSFQSLADEKDIALECHARMDHLKMDFDRDKLEKIIFNLLSNAFKFTPSLGTIRVSVDEVTENDTRFVEIRVEDSGVGIPKDQVSLIFDRFYQADNAHRANMEGSGIGLALTRELVELHGGRIKAESEVDSGTVFIVLLPVKDDSAVKESTSTHEISFRAESEATLHGEEVAEGEEQAARQDLVLVIEDNKEVREFISKSLRSEYRIIEATNGDEGIAMAIREIPDLIISDVMMPGKNGYETSRALKSDERTSHIPVVLLTAKAGTESRIEGLETGADDFIPKPFSTRELRVRIKNLITTRRKLREKFLSTALADEKPVAESIEDAFLIKIRQAVEANLDNAEFSIEDLSRELAMSRTQVHRKLKALTNQSASQFIRVIRLQHGKALLQKGQNNISEVAYKVGFSSPAYFSTCYANYFGYAPSEERSEVPAARSAQ